MFDTPIALPHHHLIAACEQTKALGLVQHGVPIVALHPQQLVPVMWALTGCRPCEGLDRFLTRASIAVADVHERPMAPQWRW
jgi:hypothetical protein